MNIKLLGLCLVLLLVLKFEANEAKKSVVDMDEAELDEIYKQWEVFVDQDC